MNGGGLNEKFKSNKNAIKHLDMLAHIFEDVHKPTTGIDKVIEGLHDLSGELEGAKHDIDEVYKAVNDYASEIQIICRKWKELEKTYLLLDHPSEKFTKFLEANYPHEMGVKK